MYVDTSSAYVLGSFNQPRTRTCTATAGLTGWLAGKLSFLNCTSLCINGLIALSAKDWLVYKGNVSEADLIYYFTTHTKNF